MTDKPWRPPAFEASGGPASTSKALHQLSTSNGPRFGENYFSAHCSVIASGGIGTLTTLAHAHAHAHTLPTPSIWPKRSFTFIKSRNCLPGRRKKAAIQRSAKWTKRHLVSENSSRYKHKHVLINCKHNAITSTLLLCTTGYTRRRDSLHWWWLSNEFLMNFPEVLLIDKMLLNHSYMYMFNMNTAWLSYIINMISSFVFMNLPSIWVDGKDMPINWECG